MGEQINKLMYSLKDGCISVCSQFFSSDYDCTEAKVFPFQPVPYFLQVNVGLIGDIQGKIYYLLDQPAAFRLASKMMMGMEVSDLDEMSTSALKELSNMMAGSSCTKMGTFGFNCDISTPEMLVNEPINPPHSEETEFYTIEMIGDPGFLIVLRLDQTQKLENGTGG